MLSNALLEPLLLGTLEADEEDDIDDDEEMDEDVEEEDDEGEGDVTELPLLRARVSGTNGSSDEDLLAVEAAVTSRLFLSLVLSLASSFSSEIDTFSERPGEEREGYVEFDEVDVDDDEVDPSRELPPRMPSS